MTEQQKEALLHYIEFHLVSMVEHVEEDVNGLAKAKLHNYAYDALKDIRDAVETWEDPVDSLT